MTEENNVVELTNVKARRDCITNGFNEIYEIEYNIAKLTEKHIKEPKALKTKAWRNLKKDVDIPRKVLDLQYRQYKAVRAAREDGENDEFNVLLDQMREVHLALHAGETIDWVLAINAADGE